MTERVVVAGHVQAHDKDQGQGTSSGLRGQGSEFEGLRVEVLGVVRVEGFKDAYDSEARKSVDSEARKSIFSAFWCRLLAGTLMSRDTRSSPKCLCADMLATLRNASFPSRE